MNIKEYIKIKKRISLINLKRTNYDVWGILYVILAIVILMEMLIIISNSTNILCSLIVFCFGLVILDIISNEYLKRIKNKEK
jgi:hypothetical protein